MTKRAIIAVLLLSMTGTAMCQLKSEGSVPADLKMSAQELYEADLQRAEAYTGGKVKGKHKLQEASYRIGKMMAGGRIVYGDPISRMAGRIADTLLKDYPELRRELRFYTVKSPEVNAFATGQGMVFINVGLVAQVENEAQLAFVLSHEIIHYYRNHSMEELMGSGKKKRDTDEERTELNEFLRRHNRSREMENEADSLGIAMFYLRSPYDKNVTEGVFDVLQYSALPFDDVPFDTAFFNTPYYQLTGCWLDTVADITSRDNYDDSRSTHPNILSRRRNTANALDGYYGGEQYVMTTKAEFEQIRQLARNECIRQELIGGEYSRAFYNAWLLKDENYMSQALYCIAMHKIKNGTNSVTGDYKKIEGESQQVYYAMRRMSNEQATLAALHKTWELHRKLPDNERYLAMSYDLMEAMRTDLKMSNIDFLSTPPQNDTAEVAMQQEEKDKPMTKYERIKQKRQAQTQRSPHGYALTDLMMSDSSFCAELKKHLNGEKKAENVEEKDSTVSNLIVYSPSFLVVNDKTDELKVDKSSQRERDLTEEITKVWRRGGQGSVDFSDAGLHTMIDAEQYNDFVCLNDWMNEFWQTKGQFDLQRLMQPEMDDLMERYGANTICMTAVLNTENLDATMSPGYLWLLPLAPVIVYNCFSNTERTTMVTLVVDAREGKVLSRQTYNYKVADHDALIDAMLYDTYVRVKDGKKNPVGFLGHRFSVTGGVNLGFSGYYPTEIGKAFSFTPWAAAEFAVSRNWSVTAGWSYLKGFDELNNFTRRESQYDANGWYIGEGDVIYTNQDVSKNMTTWNLTVRKYSNSDFAPLGIYGGFGVHWVHFTNMSDGSDGGNTFGIHAAAGRNYVFFDRLVLNIEARYSYTYGAIDLLKAMAIKEEEHRPHMADASLANFLLLKIGIGFIPF